MGSRNEVKAQTAIDRLRASGTGSGEVHHLSLDLSDVKAAEASARSFLEKEDRLDILSTQKSCLLRNLRPTVSDVSIIQSITQHSKWLAGKWCYDECDRSSASGH